jgi:beta-galactosidase/beta-glucuronidase
MLVGLCAGFSVAAADKTWQPVPGPLQTRWAKDVSPDKVWPDYPRPQMRRHEWLTLNGLWDYAIIPTNSQAPQTYEGKILVPFPVESSLSGVMRPLDEQHDLFYRRTFKVPRRTGGERILLHFGAVDWEAEVVINGHLVGTHRGGYDPFTFDITAALNPGNEQEIAVKVFDPTEGGQPHGKQVRHPKGIMYTSSSGIWQTVWLEPVPETSISGLGITPDVDSNMLRLSTPVGAQEATVEAVALDKGKEVGRTTGPLGSELQIAIPHPHLWSPQDPFLYDLKIELRQGKKRVDAVTSYFAMRKVGLGKDSKGITRLMLNGQPMFQLGPLDQGFWPDGLYTAPTAEAMLSDLAVTKKLGFNMTRKHVKVEPDLWYYDCDRLGLMVWQDMPSGEHETEEQKSQFETELKQLITTHRNHPCIVMWVVFNEGWGQYQTERLTALVKSMDPSRLVDDATGWTDKNVGDVIDMHKYPGPGSPKPEENRAAVLGEFGGLGLRIEGHTWAEKSWGYQGMTDRKALTDRYVELLTKTLALKDTPGLSAAVYTQITDVETECNGLMTYDREIVKPDVAAVAAANRKLWETK